MNMTINFDMFESDEPKQQWFNQLNVNIAIGNRYEQKGDFEKAANCYETVLIYDPMNTKTRVKIIKCYEKLLQHDDATKHREFLMPDNPHLYQSLKNEATVNFELGSFGCSAMMQHLVYRKSRKPENMCKPKSSEENQVKQNILKRKRITDYSGAKILEMVENEQLLKETIECLKLNSSTKADNFHKIQKRFQESYYLRNMIDVLKFYRKELKVLPKLNAQDKLIYQKIQEVVHTFEKAKDDLYEQKPFYMLKRQQSSHYHINDRQKVRDLIKLQVAKYMNTIMQHCLAGEIWTAERIAELAMKYMTVKFYRPLNVISTIYEAFGLALYLKNQDVPGWSDELNNKRILYILSSNVAKNDPYNEVYRDSYFGPNHIKRDHLKKIEKEINETEPSSYTLYLQYQQIKHNLHKFKYKGTRMLTKKMFCDAISLGRIGWQVNALMLTIINESRIGHVSLSIKILKHVISLSGALGNLNVTRFLKKILSLFSEGKVKKHEIHPIAIRKSEFIDMMPDYEAVTYMRRLLHRYDSLPREHRMPILPGEPKHINCKTGRSQGQKLEFDGCGR